MSITIKQRRHLSVEQKIKILDGLKEGQSMSELARLYNVSVPVVFRIKQNENKLINLKKKCSAQTVKIRKTVTEPRHSMLDEICSKWFLQQKHLNQPISGNVLRSKALEINKKIDGPASFKASGGWLRAFKKRYSIGELTFTEDKSSSDEMAVNEFRETFSSEILNNGYSYCDIYNADETGLCWKELPKRTFVAPEETVVVPNAKTCKQRVTILLCANASGTHKIPLLVIGKSQKPRCFSKIQKLPLHYVAQTSSWMDANLFLNWYKNIFIVEVKNFKINTSNNNKTVLIVDNAPAHMDPEQLNKIDPNFSVIFLPPNRTALIQPMNQGIISQFKHLYRKYLLDSLIMQYITYGFNCANNLNVPLNYACYFMNEAWKNVKSHTLNQAWKYLLVIDEASTSKDSDEVNYQEIIEKFRIIPEYQNFSVDDLNLWLNYDNSEAGLLTDDEIISGTIQTQSTVESECEDSIETMCAEYAFSNFMQFFSWFKTQRECTSEILSCLNQVKEISYNKLVTEIETK